MVAEDNSYAPISRKEAKVRGLTHYFTGIPCKRGHVTKRLVSIASCCECQRVKVEEWRADNVEWVRHLGRASHARNIEARREKDKIWYRANRARKLVLRKVWYDANRERALETAVKIRSRVKATEEGRAKIRQQNAAWKKAFPEKVRAAIDNWWAKNPGKKSVYGRNRRARKLGNGGRHSVADIDDIFKQQRSRCALCRTSLKSKRKHVDHIVALADGGGNDRRNLQILCVPCNLMKGRRDQISVMQSLGRLL